MGAVCSSTLVIIALTPGRIRTDRVRLSYILQYQHPVFHAFGLMVASTLYGYLRPYAVSDTVGFTPRIGKGHIPPDLVVDPWTSDAESSSPPDFLL